MRSIIIFPDSVGVAIVNPAPDCELPIQAIARKDVPAGSPYKIVPTTFFDNQVDIARENWTADFSSPDGYGAEYGAGTNLEVLEYFSNEDEILMCNLKNSENGETLTVQA